MTKEEIKELINIIINEDLSVHIKDKDSDIFEHIGMDSLDKVELAMGLEERLKVVIPDEEWNDINSISQTIDYIYGKINNVQNNNKAS